MTEEFNGHTNWDTWNASLWLSNDEPIYRACLRIAAASTDSSDAGQNIRDYVEMIELTGDGFDVDKVDWDSIGEEYFSEE